MSGNVYWKKIGTRSFENRLIGYIQIGSRTSIDGLARVMEVSSITLMRQLYFFVYKGEHLKLLHRVNWAWNRTNRIPPGILRHFTHEKPDPDAVFVDQLAREVTRQAVLGDISKIVPIAQLMGQYVRTT